MGLLDSGGILSLGTNVIGDLEPDDFSYHTTRYNNTCYSGVRLNSNGIQYSATNVGGWTSVGGGYWLISGANTDFWVRATLIAGTMDWTSSGFGTWLALTTTRSWGLQDTSPGVSAETGSVQLELATDSGGSNIVADVTYTLSAWNDNGL